MLDNGGSFGTRGTLRVTFEFQRLYLEYPPTRFKEKRESTLSSSSSVQNLDESRPGDSQASAGQRTPLFDWHLANGARMIPFAGWEMPIQYQGTIAEHHAVRSRAGLFDLGHMGQVDVRGLDAEAFLQVVTTNDVAVLSPWDAQYSLLPNEEGGVIDDIIIYRRGGTEREYMVVVNASNAAKDVEWLQKQRQSRPKLDVTVRDVSDQTGMIAIQGPRAEEIVANLTDIDLADVKPFSWRPATISGIATMLARTGYTGEDGFEFYTDISKVTSLWRALIKAGEPFGIVPVGLGARDTLRLEARMPLYGNELGDDISPLEAGLGWAVKLDKSDFIGKDAITQVKRDGPERRTVGFELIERGGVPRAGFPVLVDSREVGNVTSGALSPTLDKLIGLALVERGVAGTGRPLS
nr:glycine cleavage system aminomethyltransferase GcvT [Chloroflexota bacterium]